MAAAHSEVGSKSRGRAAYRLQTPLHFLPAPLSDDDLTRAVRDHEGRVFIGLKPANAALTRESGEMPAMSSTEVDSALSVLESRDDIEIGMRLLGSTILAATVDPESVARLRALPFVDYIEPSGTMISQSSAVATRGAVPPFTDSIPPGVTRIGAPTLWSDFGNEGSYATIAIIDSGVDSLHYGVELPLSIHCYHFGVAFGSCRDLSTGGHGTHVAGLAFGRRNNLGIVGAAPSPAKVIYFRACISASGTASCPDPNVAGALTWLVENPQPRMVINMSFSDTSSTFPPIKQTITSLIDILYHQKGALIVAAAGNSSANPGYDGTMYPANLPTVISVAGSLVRSQLDTVAPGSRYAESASDFANHSPELAASFVGYSADSNGTYAEREGTSMAAPLVSAAAALVWSEFPTWTNGQVRQRLRETAVRRPSWSGGSFDPHFGFGRVSALEAARPLSNLSLQMDGPTEIPVSATCTWTASTGNFNGQVTLKWDQNGHPVGDGPVFTGSRDPGISSPFTLRVVALAGGAAVASAQQTITESAMAMPCLQ